MEIKEYKKLFQTEPPEHIVKKGKIVCTVCLKNPPQIKRVYSMSGLFPCVECTSRQSNHVPLGKSSMEAKMDSLSPEEVLNGVQYGLEYNGPKSTKTWTEERREVVRDLREALK